LLILTTLDLDESDIPENSFVEESQDEGGPSNLSKDVLPNRPFLESDAESQPNVIDNETVFGDRANSEASRC